MSSLRAVAGNPPGVRASNAKGVCVKGSFMPTAEAAALSKAPMFAQPTPVTTRFAMGGGNPRIADTVKAATRGFSVRFEGAGGDTPLVQISAPMFAARTPEQLLGLVTAAWLTARPVPASFAGANYRAVTVYTLTNAKGETATVKFKSVPTAGELTLTDEEIKAKSTAFYADELRERLGKGPVTFDLVAILAQPGDVTNDSTATWAEESRRTVKLGTTAIAEIVPEAVCNAFTFDPVVLPNGMAGQVDDPLFEIRSPAYAISLSGRQ